MVEIVTRGKGKEATCEHCGSTLRYMPDEVVSVYRGANSADEVVSVYRGANYGGDTPDRYDAIKCPVCKEHTVIK